MGGAINSNSSASSTVTNKSNDAQSHPFVSFDFMVKLSKNALETDDNLKNAISKSVDCGLKQIKDLRITEIDVDCRVNGKISTDDWELPMLQKKFQKIISDRILSGHLQNICALEDRPNIRRFFANHRLKRRECTLGCTL